MHKNKRPFAGVLAFVDVPSDKAPSGAHGHRVILTKRAARASMSSLVGMGLNYKPELNGHDRRQKVGVITRAKLVGNAIHVWGYVYVSDFPELAVLDSAGLGMSYELLDAHVVDMRQPVWTISSATFSGAALLEAARAAYTQTTFVWGEQP